MIEYSINIGVVIQTGVLIGGGLIVFGMLRKSVIDMEREIVEIKQDQKDLTKTIAQIAVQDARLNRLEQDIRDLRRGDGWIVSRNEESS